MHLSSSSKKAAKHLDLVEYRSALDSYWNKHYASSAQDSIDDATERMYALHDVFPYTYTPEKSHVVELLCGFNIIAGNIERDQRHYQEAIKRLNNAVVAARENECYHLYAAALYDRGVAYLDRGQTVGANGGDFSSATMYFTRAIHDFKDALSGGQTRQSLPPYLQGYISTAMGITQSHLAHDSQDLAQALTTLDNAEKLIGKKNSSYDSFLRTGTGDGTFQEDEYHIDRASTLLGIAHKKLRNPNEVLAQLTLATKHVDAGRARRGAFIDIQRAKAYFDKEDYPRATALAMDAIAVFGSIQSWVNIATVPRSQEN